jgi:hypothetical protein
MSELPRTDDLPRTQDGYDAARVEEAFSAFAARVHDLEDVAAELRDELRALRARAVPYDEEDWPEAYGSSGGAVGPPPDWLAAVPPPYAQPFAVPRVAVEAAFLLIVALLAGLADLSTTAIVLVMAAAWALVALSEWSVAAKRRRWRLDEVAPPVADDSAEGETTGRWSMPVVEATAVAAPAEVAEPTDVSESRTVIAALPDPAAEPAEEPAEPEQKPKRRLFRLRRRDPAETDAEDPWET